MLAKALNISFDRRCLKGICPVKKALEIAKAVKTCSVRASDAVLKLARIRSKYKDDTGHVKQVFDSLEKLHGISGATPIQLIHENEDGSGLFHGYRFDRQFKLPSEICHRGVGAVKAIHQGIKRIIEELLYLHAPFLKSVRQNVGNQFATANFVSNHFGNFICVHAKCFLGQIFQDRATHTNGNRTAAFLCGIPSALNLGTLTRVWCKGPVNCRHDRNIWIFRIVIAPSVNLYDHVASTSDIFGKPFEEECLSATPVGIDVYDIRANPALGLALFHLSNQKIIKELGILFSSQKVVFPHIGFV